MLTPAAKRRRAEAASATLVRPFRSPSMRRRNGPAEPTTPVPTRKRQRKSGEGDGDLERLVDEFSRDLDAGDASLAAAGSDDGDDDDSNGATENDVDVDANRELRTLIARWREAGRMAAEDVFALVSARVAQAGGVRAWRAMTRAAMGIGIDEGVQTRRRGDDDNEEDDGDDDDREEDKDQDNQEADVDEKDTQAFTMAMMLESMHVDLNLLGYDAVEERWTD